MSESPQPEQPQSAFCSQCPTSALMTLAGGQALCVDCYYKLTMAQTLQFQQHAAMLNLAAAQMDAVVPGLSRTPRLHIPQLPPGSFSTTNVTVNGSTVGATNTATVQGIVVNMKTLGAAGHREVEGAIKLLTEAVIKSADATSVQKNEMLEQVEFVAGQTAAQPEERKPGVTKSIVGALATSAGAITDLAAVWEQVGPIIRSALGF